MFDAHIQYYAYDNTEGDEFGVGYLGNKEDWISRINRWKLEDGSTQQFTVEDWDDLDFDNDIRGIVLAELEPIDKEFVVTWVKDGDEKSLRINSKWEISWENDPQNSQPIPQWSKRLKNILRETKNQ